MKFKIGSVVVIGAAIAFLAGCASNSSFRNARPVGKGNADAFIGVSHITVFDEDFEIPGIFFEVGASAGITDAFDAIVKYTFPSTGSIEGKLTLVGARNDRGFFMAPGFRGGYTSFPTFNSGDDNDEESNDRVELAVPLYLTFSPVPKISFTVAPAYAGRFFTKGKGYSNLVGGNVNIKLGDRFGVVLEGSYFRNLRWDFDEVQGGIAFMFAIADLLF